MKIILAILLVVAFGPCSLTCAEELSQQDVTVLTEDTFLKIGETSNGLESIQLYKVENDRIYLVDAIQVQEKTVNFKPLLEFIRLKIEQKDTF